MKDKRKIFFYASRIPSAESRNASEFLRLIHRLAEKSELDCITMQTLFLDNRMVEKIKEAGAEVLSIKKSGSSLSLEEYLKKIISAKEYDYILFDSVYTAKYYLSYLKKFSPESIFIIDIRSSQYLLELKFLKYRNKDFFALPEKTIISREKEVPVYSYFDGVIVEDAFQKSVIENETHGPAVIVMGKDTDINEAFGRVRRSTDVYTPDKITRVLYKYSDEKNMVREINRILLNRRESECLLLMPEDSRIPDYFEERMYFCLNSFSENRIVIPASNLYFASYSREIIPSPENERDYNEFLIKNLLGNFAEWRIITGIREPAMMLRSSLVEDIGILDERYNSLYYALADYGFKTLLAGYRILLNQEAFIYMGEMNYYEKNFDYDDQRKLISKWGIKNAAFLESLAYRSKFSDNKKYAAGG